MIWVAAAVLGLAAVGVAAARGLQSTTVKATTATFSATSASVVRTTSCTGSDGHSYTETNATYTGTATSSDPSLNGPITLTTHSVIDTTANVGALESRVRIGSGNGANADFDAVYSGGTAVGLVEGHTQNPHARLLANVSAAFSPTGGFTNGTIGSGASGGGAVEVVPGPCRPAPGPRPERITVHGNVTAVSSTSITVAGVTCAIPSNLQARVAGLNLTSGSRVSITCVAANGADTLQQISPGRPQPVKVKTVRLPHRHVVIKIELRHHR